MRTTAEIFDEIYATKRGGYGSGGGSCPTNAAGYLQFLNAFLAELKPHSVLDIGCGDGRLAAATNWQGARYQGIDVSMKAINLFSSAICEMETAPNVDIWCGDATSGSLPLADLVISKEMTQHLDIPSIVRLIERLRSYPVILHTSMWDPDPNGEMATGGTRGIDLSAPPFNLPAKTVFEYNIGKQRYITQVWRPQ